MSDREVDRSSWKEQWELFHAALELTGSERDSFLANASASAEVRRAVERLLEVHEHGTGPLDRSIDLDLTQPSAPLDSAEAASGETPPRLAPGRVLAERFEIVRQLGEGGMGSVYEAWDPELETSLAVKVLRPEIASSEAALRRFRREIQLARQVTHPNVCRVFDFYQDGELDFLTMELVEGTTLAEILERQNRLPPETAASLIEPICEALTAAHAVGIVHRDLKPGNIMLVERGDATRVVVMDFGLARSLEPPPGDAGRLTVTGQVLGTPAYMAPEQLEGGPVGPAADIYALGVILFEAVTGHRPFEGDTPYSIVARKLTSAPPSPRTLNQALDPRWERTILRCLERRPEDRFETATEVASALRGEVRVAIPSRGRRWKRIAAWAGTALLITALAAYELWPVAGTGGVSTAGSVLPTSEEWVLVADFDNRTGDPLFDRTVTEAMRRELSNSRQIRLVPRERVGDTLRLMQRPPDFVLDADAAREVALRDGKIPVVVAGRIERVGDSYLLSADLIDVAQGSQIGGASEQAATEADVLPAIRRLSNAVRDGLGESEQEIRASTQRLDRVTTPSLEALELYTRADGLIGTDENVAIELLKEAIEKDPNFAMAYLLLAHALRNIDRPAEEYQAYAARAFELSENVPEREKLFIRGSYFSMHGEWDEAVKSYATLVRLHPDHRWAGHNLFNTLAALGRQDEAAPYVVLEADNRPNDFYAQARAALALTRWAGMQERALPYFERARQLRASLLPSNGYLEAWVEAYPAFQAWLENEPEEMERRLATLTAEIQDHAEMNRLAWLVACGYQSIGAFAASSELGGCGTPSDALLDWMRGDVNNVAALLEGRDFRGAPPTSRAEPLRLLLLARAGRADIAEAGLEWVDRQTRRTDLEVLPAHVPAIVEGAIAAAAGRHAEAVELLAPSVEAERQGGSQLFYAASDLLADEYETLGRPESALHVLETAARDRYRAIPESATFWLWIESRLAREYRHLGRDAEARDIESVLRHLLRLSDADFPVSVTGPR